MGEPAADVRLVLASSSPRRRALLERDGYRFSVHVPQVEEKLEPGEPAASAAKRLALEKARAVADRADRGACVLAADTLVVLDDEILGKPVDRDDACRMLLRLAGRTHEVVTGYALIQSDAAAEPRGAAQQGVVRSRVRMRAISEAEARAYAETGEPLDKAGGYALQGEAGRFVEQVDGSRDNVIGLPLAEIAPLLERLGVKPLG